MAVNNGMVGAREPHPVMEDHRVVTTLDEKESRLYLGLSVTHVLKPSSWKSPSLRVYISVWDRFFAWISRSSIRVNFNGKHYELNKKEYAEYLDSILPKKKITVKNVSQYRCFQKLVNNNKDTIKKEEGGLANYISSHHQRILQEKLTKAIDKEDNAMACDAIAQGAYLETYYPAKGNLQISLSGEKPQRYIVEVSGNFYYHASKKPALRQTVLCLKKARATWRAFRETREQTCLAFVQAGEPKPQNVKNAENIEYEADFFEVRGVEYRQRKSSSKENVTKSHARDIYVMEKIVNHKLLTLPESAI